MSKKINLDDYKGKYVIHCKTEEEAKDFCRVLHEAGRKWNDGESYLECTFWDLSVLNSSFFGDTRYYQFNDGLYTTRPVFVRDYTILEWSDFMNKEFTKDDLRDFDIVLRRDGEVRVVLRNHFVNKDFYSTGICRYNNDLTWIKDSRTPQDIIKVIRPTVISDLSFDAFEKNLGRLVYERDETVEMTFEEVCKALGKNVKIVKEK